MIDRGKRRSRFTVSLPAVQKLIDHVGSVHNIHLAKLWHARKCLLVEGDDLKLLSELQHTLAPHAADSLTTLPNMSIGGWGGWQRAVGSSLFVQSTAGESIVTYCILDSDYHSDEEIAERYAEALSSGVHLHVWQRKEIENYLLVPAAIARYVSSRAAAGTEMPDIVSVQTALEELAARYWDETFDAISTSLLARDRGLGAAGANKLARDILTQRCPQAKDKLLVVSGKRLLSALSQWTQERFGVGISVPQLARSLGHVEITSEVRQVLTAINAGGGMPAWKPRYQASSH